MSYFSDYISDVYMDISHQFFPLPSVIIPNIVIRQPSVQQVILVLSFIFLIICSSGLYDVFVKFSKVLHFPLGRIIFGIIFSVQF